jgi:hypothetical protein
MNKAIIGGIAAAVVVGGGIGYYAYSKRSKKPSALEKIQELVEGDGEYKATPVVRDTFDLPKEEENPIDIDGVWEEFETVWETFPSIDFALPWEGKTDYYERGARKGEIPEGIFRTTDDHGRKIIVIGNESGIGGTFVFHRYSGHGEQSKKICFNTKDGGNGQVTTTNELYELITP